MQIKFVMHTQRLAHSAMNINAHCCCFVFIWSKRQSGFG